MFLKEILKVIAKAFRLSPEEARLFLETLLLELSQLLKPGDSFVHPLLGSFTPEKTDADEPAKIIFTPSPQSFSISVPFSLYVPVSVSAGASETEYSLFGGKEFPQDSDSAVEEASRSMPEEIDFLLQRCLSEGTRSSFQEDEKEIDLRFAFTPIEETGSFFPDASAEGDAPVIAETFQDELLDKYVGSEQTVPPIFGEPVFSSTLDSEPEPEHDTDQFDINSLFDPIGIVPKSSDEILLPEEPVIPVKKKPAPAQPAPISAATANEFFDDSIPLGVFDESEEPEVPVPQVIPAVEVPVFNTPVEILPQEPVEEPAADFASLFTEALGEQSVTESSSFPGSDISPGTGIEITVTPPGDSAAPPKKPETPKKTEPLPEETLELDEERSSRKKRRKKVLLIGFPLIFLLAAAGYYFAYGAPPFLSSLFGKSEFEYSWHSQGEPVLLESNVNSNVAFPNAPNAEPRDFFAFSDIKVEQPELIVLSNDKPEKDKTETENKVVVDVKDPADTEPPKEKPLEEKKVEPKKEEKKVEPKKEEKKVEPKKEEKKVEPKKEEKKVEPKKEEKKVEPKKTEPPKKTEQTEQKEEPKKDTNQNVQRKTGYRQKGIIVPEGGTYYFQVASWEDREGAENEAAQLRTRGFEVNIVMAEVPEKGIYYRVRLGPFTTYEQMNAVIRRL